MRTIMNCPKCDAILRRENSNYAYAKFENGEGRGLIAYFTCWRCGYHKDIDFTPKVKVKDLAPEPPQDTLPRGGKPGDGIITEAVKKNFASIAQRLRAGRSWGEITKHLQGLYDTLDKATPQAVMNAYHRLRKERSPQYTLKGSSDARI